jgi:hypothetical protein
MKQKDRHATDSGAVVACIALEALMRLTRHPKELIGARYQVPRDVAAAVKCSASASPSALCFQISLSMLHA